MTIPAGSRSATHIHWFYANSYAGKIRAHKFVLSLVSDVFLAQFSSKFSDLNQEKGQPSRVNESSLHLKVKWKMDKLTARGRKSKNYDDRQIE